MHGSSPASFKGYFWSPRLDLDIATERVVYAANSASVDASSPLPSTQIQVCHRTSDTGTVPVWYHHFGTLPMPHFTSPRSVININNRFSHIKCKNQMWLHSSHFRLHFSLCTSLSSYLTWVQLDNVLILAFQVGSIQQLAIGNGPLPVNVYLVKSDKSICSRPRRTRKSLDAP